MEDHVRFHSYFFRQGLQTGAILVSLAAENMRVGCARDDVHNILVLRQNLGQRLNYVFNSLIRREQSECKQDGLAFHAKTVFVEIRVEKRHVRNAMRHHVDLAARHFEYLLQELGRELAHHDKAVGEVGDLLHDHELIWIRLAQYGVQRGHHRHLECAQQMEDVASRRTSEDPILVLQAHHVDVVEVQEFRRVLVGLHFVLGKRPAHTRRVVISLFGIVYGQGHQPCGSILR